ncbi:MAG: FAD:protein FMN transferase [Bacteroidales bacterium]|nr:FAD:protein FMN transferase [Bacteroidales bacterium]NLH23807.1 FAD:protein FMN transferase [Bacteroidales bacterium]HPJ82638.1 FAD:protein FMN transferase [Bacteroidales bacterium]
MTKKPYPFIFLCFLFLFTASCNQRAHYMCLEGSALGTTYAITFRIPEGAPSAFPDIVEQTLASGFERINNSLSIYNNHSLISRINKNLTQETDSLFRTVFNRSMDISILTNGAFDISAAPFFDLWGFGFEKRDILRQDSLELVRQYTGMDKFRLEGTALYKADPRCSLSMNAIAKGYACDLIAGELSELEITDMLVEIGGEIVCRGLNPKKRPWRIGIDSPVDGNIHPGENIQAVITMTDKGLATSGNYRNYYIENGKKYAHIIDPQTGLPVKHNLLSATVIAPDCMSADAFATALMVMGLAASIDFLNQHPELGAYLIYEQGGVFKTYATDNIIIEL